MHGGCVATIIDICSSFAILVFEGIILSRYNILIIPCGTGSRIQSRRQTQVEVDWCLY